MAAPVVAMRGIAVAIGPLPTCPKARRRPIRCDQKSTSGEGMIAMRREPAFAFLPKFQGRDRRLHLRPMLRERRRGEPRRTYRLTSRPADRDECPKNSPNSKRPPISTAEYSPSRLQRTSMRDGGRPGRRRPWLSLSERVGTRACESRCILRLKLTIDVAARSMCGAMLSPHGYSETLSPELASERSIAIQTDESENATCQSLNRSPFYTAADNSSCACPPKRKSP